MTTAPRILAALKLPTHIPDAIKSVQAILDGMTGNPSFSNPQPPLATFSASIAALSAAETVAATKAKGAAQARDEKLSVVISQAHQLKAYVQQVADAAPAQAETIILSGGFAIKKPATRAPNTFEARRGAVSGAVHLVAKAAGARASYEWQWSLDGKTWTNAPVTLQAKTTIQALTVGSTYSFRYRPVTRTGEGDWSEVATLLVS